MPTHIGFLRAVNVGKRQYKTADLRDALLGAGYTDVETHLQTGNIRVSSRVRSTAQVEADLEALFLADRGFEVTTIVLSPDTLARVVAEADQVADSEPEHGQYVTLLKQAPSPELAAAVEALAGEGERLVVRGRAVHLLLDVPYGTSRTPRLLEKAAGPATNRNLTVLRALAEKWGA